MRYKISNAYLTVNGENIPVGVVLGHEDSPESPFRSETITVSEFERGLESFEYGAARINDAVFHRVGTFENFKAVRHVDQKWIDELKKQGYDTSKLINVEPSE